MSYYRAAMRAVSIPPRVEVLISVMHRAASDWWRYRNAREALRNMSIAERDTTPDYAEQLADAQAGMTAAENEQREASTALEAMQAMPKKLKAWPERRSLPRLALG